MLSGSGTHRSVTAVSAVNPDPVIATERESTSLLAGVRRAFVVRAATMPVAALAGLLAARVTVSTLGVDGYALFALVVGLAALNPVGDLGVGAAVTDAVARRHELGADGVERVLRTSLRVLVVVSVALAVTAWAFAALGSWATLLGVPPSRDVEVAVATALTLFAVGLPLGLSSRVLLGAERNDIALAYQGSSGVLALLIILLASAAHAPLWAYVAAPSAATALAAAAAWPMASAASGLALSGVARSAAVRARAGTRIGHLAWPMMVIMAALPIAYQSDRLLLSHFSTLHQVAIYSLGGQLYGFFFGLVGAAGMSLWPIFARRRAHQPISRHELIRLMVVFALVGALLAAAIVAIGPWVAQFVSKGEIHVGYDVFAAFGILLVVQASWVPIGMLLTDRDGLRFQAGTHVVMMVINLVASAVLAERIGAAGPIVGSVGALAIAVWVPGVWRALSRAQKSPVGAPTARRSVA
jgi:O-antigen/teichoic acid export membrane protein